MRFTGAFAFVLALLSITSIASPLSPPTNVMRSVGSGPEIRQSDIVRDVIIAVVNKIVDEVINFDHDMHIAEAHFTQQTVHDLRAQRPDKNVLVFHNQKSQYDLSPDAVHYHYELDIGLGFTQGYEIWVFDSGVFSLAGDAGYENWAYDGCVSGTPTPSTLVVFTKCGN